MHILKVNFYLNSKQKGIIVCNFLKIASLLICLQTPLNAMNFARIAGKVKSHPRSIKRHTITSPKFSCVGRSEGSLRAETEKESSQALPLDHCINSDMMCSCVKKYSAVTIKQIEDYNANAGDTLNGLREAKQRLDYAIDLFKNNPHVCNNLTNIKSKLCQNSNNCPPDMLDHRLLKRCLINGLKIGVGAYVGFYFLGSFDEALCFGTMSLPICMMAGFGLTRLTHRERCV